MQASIFYRNSIYYAYSIVANSKLSCTLPQTVAFAGHFKKLTSTSVIKLDLQICFICALVVVLRLIFILIPKGSICFKLANLLKTMLLI